MSMELELVYFGKNLSYLRKYVRCVKDLLSKANVKRLTDHHLVTLKSPFNELYPI